MLLGKNPNFANFAENRQVMHTREEKLEQFGRLLDIMDALREKCPWNAEQTMESIRPMTEEDYRAGGCTALLDAVGIAIDDTGKRLASLPEEQRPANVIIGIMTGLGLVDSPY